jgi:GalNAc-alpha-(1->4)-GalNAc-alpha-(1->3)-diNAcBac-PP-undecaprenol alpha-1,4-N-acetyl-D-galactosaminyltransferase
MKIDFVIGRMKAGGAERVICTLANYFAEKGHTVRIVTFINGDDYKLSPLVKRVRFHKKYFIKYSIVRGFFYLLYFYFKKNNRPDVISSHISLMGYATIPIALIYKINISVSEHSSQLTEKHDVLRSFLWNFLYKYPNAVTVLTSLDLPFFADRTKYVIVMPNPCSFEFKKLENTKREKTILAVGNLDRYHGKGFDNLIQIASDVLRNNSEWTLKIVGAGDNGLGFLKNEVKKFDIENKVIFTGFRNDIKDIMANSEIYILTSRHEGLPMVLIEAMSQGMACISYDCVSGPSDIIKNEINGILVSDQNHKEMKAKLNSLLINNELRETLRNNSIKSLEKFSIKNVGEKWEKLFDSFYKIN